MQQKEDSQLSSTELRKHLEGVIAHFEIPSKWWIRTDPLPVTPTGKIDKPSVLRQWSQQPAGDTAASGLSR